LKWIVLLIIILYPFPVNSITIKKIDEYSGVNFNSIKKLYCSSTKKSIKFNGKNQYRSFYVTIISLHNNGIVRIEYPEEIINNTNIIKILKGEEKAIKVKILPFDGERKILFYDEISNKLLSVIVLKGVIESPLSQRTIVQYNKNIRVYHNIRYKDWSFNIGLMEEDNNNLKYNFSLSKKW